MFANSQIPAETLQAYLATEFRVLCNPPFILKLNQASPELGAIYRQRQVQTAAFLTAWNPYSEAFTLTDNDAAQKLLLDELNRRKLSHVPGIGVDPSGEWPGEESYLVLGMSIDDAREVGHRFKQNGIVWAGADSVPELILLR